MPEITGKRLYEVYKSKFAENNVIVDEWEDLDELDQKVWALIAIELSFGE